MKTYGTIELKTVGAKGGYGGVAPLHWCVKAEPHVRLRLKRTFARIATDAEGVIVLLDTPEVGRELAWFLQRFPMKLTQAGQQRLEQRSAEHVEREEMVYRVLAHDYQPNEVNLALQPRDYQRVAIDLAIRSKGLLLADEVGLGKTLCGIGLMTAPDALPALVVTLTHLPRQWQREIERFAPDLRVFIPKTTDPLKEIPRSERKSPLFRPNVYVMNYHKLAGWKDYLAGRVKSVIFDEAQELRRDESEKYRSAKQITVPATYRLALSATPFYNYGGELFNVIDVLNPDSLGSREEFSREWCSDRSIKDPKAFGTYLRDAGLMLRRTRTEVGRELPGLTIIPVEIDSDQAALDAVEDAASELARIILTQGGQARGEKLRASEELSWRLRQATGISKARAVAEFVKILVEQGERVVLFGWHREVYSLLAEHLKDQNPAFVTGAESANQKAAAIERFVNKETDVLIMSLRAGAGIDGLQHVCRTVIFAELDWSPGVHEQCLSADTEILSRRGFVGPDTLVLGEEIAAFDHATGKIRWVPTLQKTDRQLDASESMYACRTEKIDIRVTGEHRMVVRRKRRTKAGVSRSDWDIALAGEIAGMARCYVPVSGIEDSPGVPLTDYEIRLLGWYITDGSFSGRILTIYQASHQPWNEDAVEVLNGCGLKWTRYQRLLPERTLPDGQRSAAGPLMNMYCIPKGNLHRWSVDEVDRLESLLNAGTSHAEVGSLLNRSTVAVRKKAKKLRNYGSGCPVAERTVRGWEHLEPYLDKDLSPLLEGMTRSQLKWYIHGVKMGDGAKSARLKNVVKITNSNKTFLDRLQSLCVRNGFSANISKRRPPQAGRKQMYSLWIMDSAEDAILPHAKKPNGFAQCKSTPGERVWCATNELGTLITRRNGKVAILGNCIGRVARDGQTDPVVAYFLVSDSGSDPVVADVLGLKRQQIDGVRDPDAGLIEKLTVDDGHIKRLAERHLANAKRKHGVAS